MGKEKSIEEEELKKFAVMMANLEGHYLSLTIASQKLGDKDWKAVGNIKVGSSLDGKHWGELEAGVTGFDVDSESAIATVMVSINNYINSPEFVVEMGQKLVQSLEEPPKLPEAMDI